MTSRKTRLKLSSLAWHKKLGWIGGTALLLFTFSAFMHPLMVWTSPQPASFYPPQMTLEASALPDIAQLLDMQNIRAAKLVKMLPSNNKTMLQITQEHDAARLYIDSITGELQNTDYDEKHAVWLARYYTGLQDTPVTQVEFITEFSEDYPWVNRLLPVYKVHFATDDNLHAYIYTETNALGALSNDWKELLQGIFQTLHTFSWLDGLEIPRIALMLILLISVLVMAATGTAMIFTFKRRAMKDGKRRWHRRIAYVIWIPIFALAISGTIHLLYYSVNNASGGIKLADAMPLDKLSETRTNWQQRYENVPLNSVSLVMHDNQFYYRLGIAAGKHGQEVSRHQRFDGTAIETSALYIHADTGEESALNDAAFALQLADNLTGKDAAQFSVPEIVTSFSPDYDFRNKRLPVWKLTSVDDARKRIFIDPASQILVEQVSASAYIEGRSFSWLHKWNMLTPVFGRIGRDVFVMIILVISFTSAALGMVMLWRVTKHRKNL